MDTVTTGNLLASLGERLDGSVLSTYRFPTCGDGYFMTDAADEMLLFVLADDASIHLFRETFLDMWKRAGAAADAIPLVTTHEALRRHLRLKPLFAHHLMRSAQLVSGEPLFSEDISQAHVLEQLAFMSRQLVEGSAALAPDLLTAEQDVLARRRLIRLARCLGDPYADTMAEIPDLFARLQVHLRHLIERLPIGQEVPEAEVPEEGSVPLKALYEDEDRLLAVIPALSSRVLRQVDWPAFSGHVPDHLSHLSVSTDEQLYLIIQAERALDYVLGGFKHVQGAHPLNGLHVRARATFRQAARKPSELLFKVVPQAYLMAGDERALNKVLHDYQNRLLNISLEHELLHRSFGVPLATPEEALPRQDEPVNVRIDAILAHLDWWADTYVREMDRRSPEERLAPV